MFRFFVDRPIFASVISLIIVIAGIAAFIQLPVSEYPEVAPPTVVITTNYPGASAQTLANTVAAPIEQQLSGVEGLLYYQSAAGADGSLQIIVTFETGTNIDQATINTNNRVQIALPQLPETVRRNGVVVQKRSIDILMFATVLSPKKTRDSVYLSNYATLNMVDELKRIPGVADATIAAARDYSMRIWLRPDRMAQLGVTATDIANAIRAQNAQYATGNIGQNPSPQGQTLIYAVNVQGQLRDPEQFGNIILRSTGPGGVLRLKDVARVELGAQNYDLSSLADGDVATSIAVYLQTGSNALQTSKLVRAKLDELKSRFPDDVEYRIFFDTTVVVSASIHEVLVTLSISAVLVLLVVFVFLQNWRATIIPMVAVPVSLIGTAAGLWIFGFSINQFSLFAMVLAIGIVVDDAIVVLENVERLMRTEGMSAKEASVEAMREVASAIVAIVLVLCAVFIPVAFLGGIAGKLYQQFAVTIAVAVVISGVVALTLTPALCAILLKPSDHENPIFHPFNVGFAKVNDIYNKSVAWVMTHGKISLGLFLLVIAIVAVLFRMTPTGFVPAEDRGFVITSVILPDGASPRRTFDVAQRVAKELMQDPAVAHVNTTVGNDFLGGGNKPNASSMFITLKLWDQRPLKAADYTDKFLAQMRHYREGLVLFFNAAPIRGIGSSSGFELVVQSRADTDAKRLAQVVNLLVDALKQNPKIVSATTFFRPSTPQLFVDVDEAKAIAQGVSTGDVFDTLTSTIGTLYVNDFNKSGRTYRVLMQNDADYRAKPDDIGKVYVRSNSGAMIPLSVLTHIRYIDGPQQVNRFNGFLAGGILGSAAPGISSGEAIRVVEETAAKVLPDGYTIAWAGAAFQEKRTGKAAVLAFVFGIVMVFLILAAQFEKWSLPLAVILAVPFAMLGAFIAVQIRGMPNDVYFQIGLVVLVGLASKNAILIVEFASQKHAEGMSSMQAAIEAARLRFRPIVMTSLAFVLGVVPLIVATGAGAGARRSMGTGVFGGMIAATFIATAFIPLFYVWLSPDKKRMATSHSGGEQAE
jgi:hydrophobe/amphiphile efflux-1 (HAE1) family protein